MTSHKTKQHKLRPKRFRPALENIDEEQALTLTFKHHPVPTRTRKHHKGSTSSSSTCPTFNMFLHIYFMIVALGAYFLMGTIHIAALLGYKNKLTEYARDWLYLPAPIMGVLAALTGVLQLRCGRRAKVAYIALVGFVFVGYMGNQSREG